MKLHCIAARLPAATLRAATLLVATLLVATLLAMMLLGCGTPGMPLPPSLELPQVVQDLRASRKGDTVYLAWTVPRETTDRTALRVRRLGATRVCRSLTVGMTQCSDKAGEVDTAQLVTAAEAAAQAKVNSAGTSQKGQRVSARPAPMVASFRDKLPREMEQQNPTGFITYAVETLNTRGRSAGFSNQVQVALAPTLPPPTDMAAKVTADGIVLSWSAEAPAEQAPDLRHRYRVYRQEQGGGAAALVGEVDAGTSPHAQLVDHSFEWQKTYQYWVTVVSVVLRNGRPAAEVEGDNSPPITVFANDVFPPAAPGGLQAVFSGPGQQPFVDLTWAPNTEPDLAGYNVYRREGRGAWTRLNSALVLTPSYRDSNVAAGRTYFYAVTAVDTHGNESARSPEAGETVPRT